MTGEQLITEIQKIKTVDDKLQFWERICERDTDPNIWLPGKALEYFILRCFELETAEVKYPYEVKIQGYTSEQIDGVVYINNNYQVICECKDYNEAKINIEPIAKLRYQLCRRPINAIGCVFSMTDFTEPATILINYINGQSILLWGFEDIDYAVKNQAFIATFIAKYRFAIEYGNYFSNINAILNI